MGGDWQGIQTQNPSRNLEMALGDKDLSILNLSGLSSLSVPTIQEIAFFDRDSTMRFESGRGTSLTFRYCCQYLNFVLFMLCSGDDPE